MARIRTVKPDFFTSDDICALSPLARLLYIGLWCEADREGRLVWAPRTFRRRYLPEDDGDIADICQELLDRDLVRLYGDGLAHIPTFLEHQHVNPREAASVLPAPDTHASPRDSDAQVGREGKEGEGKGRNTDTSVSGASRSGTRLPDDWEPSADERAFAEQLGLNATTVAASFRDYWRGIPGAKGRKADWPGTWRNWCRREAERIAAKRVAPQTFAARDAAVAATTVNRDDDAQWRARISGWRPGKMWLRGDWGPEPGEPGCRVPPAIYSEWAAKKQERAAA